MKRHGAVQSTCRASEAGWSEQTVFLQGGCEILGCNGVALDDSEESASNWLRHGGDCPRPHPLLFSEIARCVDDTPARSQETLHLRIGVVVDADPVGVLQGLVGDVGTVQGNHGLVDVDFRVPAPLPNSPPQRRLAGE